jgi:hypothetical protein
MELTEKEIDLLKSLIIDKKQELETLLNKLNDGKKVLSTDNAQSFKDKHKDLNQSDLEWLINILNPDQYQKVERNSNKTDILYKKDGITYMLQDTKTDWWYLDYDLIWSVFETKFGYNYQLFKDLTKGILVEIYKCKVVTTVVYPLLLEEVYNCKMVQTID